jgi:hypothetical protein
MSLEGLGEGFLFLFLRGLNGDFDFRSLVDNGLVRILKDQAWIFVTRIQGF